MHQLNKHTNKQKLPSFSPVNFQYIAEADVCSMPPPSKQAKLSLVEQTTCDNVSDGAVSRNLRTANSSKITTDLRKDVSLEEHVTISSNLDHKLHDTVKSLITCAICLEIQGHAYQCENGHLICVNCATRLLQQHTNSEPTCPSCRVSLQIGLRRCLLAEQLAAELPCHCRFCDAQMARKFIKNHETVKCPERPVMCRFNVIGCPWKGKWIELDNHIGQCIYKDKRVSEVETVLATALVQNQIISAERNHFQRGLLTQLAKSSTGLKAFRRQIGVFCDATQSDTTDRSTWSTAVYQSTNNRLRCCGLRRVALETTINFSEGQLFYRFKSKSENSSEISFRLCLVQCGDVEFDVIDQLHSFNFSPNHKETPSYATTLIYHRDSDVKNESNLTFSQLTVKGSYIGFPMETLKQSNNLLLEFLLLKDKCDVLEVRLNGNNNEYSAAMTELMPEASTTTNLNRNFANDSATDEIQASISNESNATQSYWQQILHSPTTSLLRPLLNLLFSNREQSTGNNNAPFVIGPLPQPIVVTLTSLSPTDTRIRVVGLGNGTPDALEDTENENSDENSSEEEVVEDEDNADTSEDELHSSGESDTENEVDDRFGERNNNAYTDELNEESAKPISVVDKSSGFSIGESSDSAKPRSMEYLTAQASSCLTNPETSATNRNGSNAPSVEQRKILRPVRKNNARLPCNEQRKLGTKASVRGVKRTNQYLQRGYADISKIISSRDDNSEDSNFARPNLNDFEVGPSNPKRIEQHVVLSETITSKLPRCKYSPWLQKVMHTFTGMARYLIRAPVATPLSYLTASNENSKDLENLQNPSVSDNPRNVQCDTPYEQTPFAFTRTWTLPMATSDTVNDFSNAQNSDLDKTKYLPVDSLPPRMRSLRADVLKEIIHLARRATSKTRKVSSTENNTPEQNNPTIIHSERACQTTGETLAVNRGTYSRNKNTSNKHAKRSTRPPRNRKPTGRRK